jgi:flagellar basal-body rod protein FlgB
MGILFNDTVEVLTAMIHGTTLRHEVLSRNVANLETPGYRAQDVSFRAALRSAILEGPGEPGQAPAAPGPRVRTVVREEPGRALRPDGNTVDLDQQMVKVAQNAMTHNGLVHLLNSRFNLLRLAMRERG